MYIAAQNTNVKTYDNFALVRLMLSLLVLVTHFQVLSGTYFLWFKEVTNSTPHFAIGAFFVISGYVILGSFEKLSVLKYFYLKRFLRVYPLYFVVIIFQALLMLWIIRDEIAGQVSSIIKYLAANFIMLNFLQPDLGGVFSKTINPAVNPSLWTLKIEMMFYLLAPGIYFLFRRFGFISLVLIFILSVVYNLYFNFIGMPELAKQIPGELRYIVVGSIMCFYRHKLNISEFFAKIFCFLGIILTTIFHDKIPVPLYPLFLGLVIIILATKISLPRPNIDLSYGVFIIHAPLIQFSILWGIYKTEYWFLGVIITASCLLAYLGCKLVEEPCIALGKYISKQPAKS